MTMTIAGIIGDGAVLSSHHRFTFSMEKGNRNIY